jgi:molybdenum cofactor cytidylyltransferase
MGQAKLLLPFRGKTILHAVVEAFLEAGVARVLVVATPQAPGLLDTARAAGAHSLLLDQATPDMRATVDCGLKWIEKLWSPAATDGWFLSPADHPRINAVTIQALLRAANERNESSVFLPVHAGRRGHPVLIRWSEVGNLRAFPREQGVNAFLRSIAERVSEITVAEAAGFRDLDTPDDYQRLLLEGGRPG